MSRGDGQRLRVQHPRPRSILACPRPPASLDSRVFIHNAESAGLRSGEPQEPPEPVRAAGHREGEIVCIKGGHVLDRRRLAEIQAGLGPGELQIAEDLFIGPARGEERDGGMIFSNHSCEANIVVQGQIVFVAIRDVAAGEELTHDWAMTDNDGGEMACKCGAAKCRGLVTG